MPTSKRELALAEVQLRLAAIAGIAGLVVERNRRDEVAAFPRIVQRDGGHAVAPDAVGYERLTITVDLELYVRVAAGVDYGEKLNELYAAAVEALCADRTLGGLALELLQIGMSTPAVDTTDTSTKTAVATATFEVEVLQSRDTPY